MAEQSVCKTYKDNLNPTPEQERELGRVLGLRRSLYNTALERRISAFRRSGVSVSRCQQEAEVKDGQHAQESPPRQAHPGAVYPLAKAKLRGRLSLIVSP